MAQLTDSGPVNSGPPAPPRRGGLAGTATTTGVIVKIVVLGLVLGIAIWGMFPLIEAKNWFGLAILIVVTAILFFIYLTPRYIPAKYLVVGTLFLIAFQVIPVIKTATTAFTNYGDGHLGTKADAIAAIEASSVKEVPGSGSTRCRWPPTPRAIWSFLLTSPDKKTYVGTAEGLKELAAADVTTGLTGKITKANGYTVLTLGQASARGADISALIVPTEQGAIRAQGLTAAFEGKATQTYDPTCDCVTDSVTNVVYTADNSIGNFVAPNGDKLAQGWQVNVGFRNFGEVVTNPVIRGPVPARSSSGTSPSRYSWWRAPSSSAWALPW